jgi:cobalamin biosynthetic protein CobC
MKASPDFANGAGGALTDPPSLVSARDRAGPLHHGGRLRAAANHYGLALDQWLDLSTGINPNGWPVPPVPASAWGRLPEEEDGLEQAARAYYGAAHLLPVAGSQAAIQALPRLHTPARVGVLSPGYAEHAAAWRAAGHAVRALTAGEVDQAIPACDVLVLIHPNNPTGTRWPLEQVLDWHAQLATRGGWLLIDEAFMDTTPDQSLCSLAARPGLIVLRSLGKFFGLAGARVGFVCAQPGLLAGLQRLLGPWSLNAPARWVAQAALKDSDWQARERPRLVAAGERLGALLRRQELAPQGGCALFQWVRTPQARDLHQALARQGILTRLFEDPASLRLGLPGTDADWTRLDAVLTRVVAEVLPQAAANPHEVKP